jgi:ribosomal protein S18
VNFFADKKNAKYINRKAVTMLKKYITRFGNIKPREYTHNSVSTQKKIKTVILRARELGFMAYTK